MSHRYFAPLGADAMNFGTLVDDDGQRFVGVNFRDEQGDEITVTMNIPLFRLFADQAQKMAALAETRDHWRNHSR